MRLHIRVRVEEAPSDGGVAGVHGQSAESDQLAPATVGLPELLGERHLAC